MRRIPTFGVLLTALLLAAPLAGQERLEIVESDGRILLGWSHPAREY